MHNVNNVKPNNNNPTLEEKDESEQVDLLHVDAKVERWHSVEI